MNGSSFLTVCLNPCIQKTLVFPAFNLDAVNRTGEYRLDASGKGVNVTRVLTQLGKDCVHLTHLGGVFRPIYLDLAGRDNLRVEWVESSCSIRFAYTLLDRKEKTVTELIEESERVGEETPALLLDAFSSLLPNCSCLIISGTMASGYGYSMIPEMVRKARIAGRRVLLDIRGKDLLNSLSFGPDLIKPNLQEFVTTFAPELASKNPSFAQEKDLKTKIQDIWGDLYEMYPCALVLTRGEDPVWYAEKGELSEYRFEKVEPFNTTGSGDAFTAGLGAALEEGASLKDAVAQGTRCGALNAALLRPGVIF